MIKTAALLLTVLIAAAATGAVVLLPRVRPAYDDAIYNTITRFDTDHPDWRLLAEKRIDATPLAFEHQVHMNPATPKMQETLQNRLVKPLLDAGVDPALIPVRKLEDGQMVLTCTACHQPEPSGRYMQPIRFENHCVACHSLGSHTGTPIPHGAEVASFIDRKAADAALGLVAKPAPPAPAAGSGPGGARRGPGGPKAAAAPAAPKPVTFPSQDQLNETLAKNFNAERNKIYGNLTTNSCVKCHKQINELRQQAGGDWTKIDWAQVDPAIPDRWLPKSVFDHQAHRMMACVSCHADADPPRDAAAPRYPDDDDPASPASKLAWTGRTKQIMIPDIASCRECHSADASTEFQTRFDCVMCHTYHAPDVAPNHGGAFTTDPQPLNPLK